MKKPAEMTDKQIEALHDIVRRGGTHRVYEWGATYSIKGPVLAALVRRGYLRVSYVALTETTYYEVTDAGRAADAEGYEDEPTEEARYRKGFRV